MIFPLFQLWELWGLVNSSLIGSRKSGADALSKCIEVWFGVILVEVTRD